MSRASKRKGSGGELEVAKILSTHGFNARRTPRSGAWEIPGDVFGVPGYAIEVKRRERLNIWEALAQAHVQARGGNQPLLVFRRNNSPWWACSLLDTWAAREAELQGLADVAA